MWDVNAVQDETRRKVSPGQTYVEEAKIESPENQKHPNGEEDVGWFTEGGPLYDRAGLARWKTRSQQ